MVHEAMVLESWAVTWPGWSSGLAASRRTARPARQPLVPVGGRDRRRRGLLLASGALRGQAAHHRACSRRSRSSWRSCGCSASRAAGRIVRAGLPRRDRVVPRRCRPSHVTTLFAQLVATTAGPAAVPRSSGVASSLGPRSGYWPSRVRPGRAGHRPSGVMRGARADRGRRLVLAIKAVVIPWALLRAVARPSESLREEAPLVNPTADCCRGVALTVLAFLVSLPIAVARNARRLPRCRSGSR